MSLQGYVSFTGGAPLINWKLYSGPGTVSFSNASVTNTTTTFNSAGTYTLMLSADDSVHAVAYDAVVINVTADGQSQQVVIPFVRKGDANVR